MGDAGNRFNILILDACRDNPFTRSWRSASTGLAAMTGVRARGVLVAYATAPGHTAADGSGRNSPYTRQLLRQIDDRGIPVESFFKRVGAAVQQETGRKQVPWVSLSLIGDFYSVEDPARG